MAITFNPFTGNFDFLGTSSGGSGIDNFSYYEIPVGVTLVVPGGQEMIVTQDIMVRGDLIVRGITTQLQDLEYVTSFWSIIPLNKSVIIPQDRVMFYKSALTVLGNLRVIGDLMEVA